MPVEEFTYEEAVAPENGAFSFEEAKGAETFSFAEAVAGPEAMNKADLFFETFKQHLAEEPKLPPFFENQFNIPVPPVDRVRAVAPYLPGSETIAEAVTGTMETVLPAVSSMTSPAMITAVAAMGSGGVAAKLAAGGFAGMGAKGMIEGTPEFIKAVKEGDVQGAFRHGTGLAMSGLMMMGAIGPKFNSVPRPAARAGEVPPVLLGAQPSPEPPIVGPEAAQRPPTPTEPVKFAQEAIAKAAEVAPLTAKALEEAVAPVGTVETQADLQAQLANELAAEAVLPTSDSITTTVGEYQPAVKSASGKIFTADSHEDALKLMGQSTNLEDSTLAKNGRGFVENSTGRFLNVLEITNERLKKIGIEELNLPEKKEAPVTYAGFQQGFGKIPGKDIYTLTEDLPGTKFVKNDTVTANDLKAAGFEIPESARPTEGVRTLSEPPTKAPEPATEQPLAETVIPEVVTTEAQAEVADVAKTKGGETQGAIATAGPALMPAMPAGAPLTPVKAISEIVRDLAKGLDIPIRFGRLTTSKYAGYFKKNPNLIGAKLANDMPIVAHEVGHKLDAAYPFTSDATLRPELDALGDPAIAGSRSSWTPSKSAKYKRSEGFAEFVRHWLTDPAESKRLAPATHTIFERILDANEDLSAVMRQAQADIQLWRNAPQEARLDSSISRSDPNKARYSLPNLMRDVVDDLHFLRMAVDDAKVSGPVAAGENPYQLARSLRGSYGMADTFIRKGVVDFKTREVKMGTDLNSALEPVAGRMNEFRRWIVAKRAQELRSQGRETGLNSADVDFVADKYGKDAAFQEAFAKVKAWNDALLKYTEDSGMVSPESAALIREMNQDYVPFHRVFEVGAGESPAVSGGGSGRGLNVGTPGSLKRLKGSQRDVVDPLETMIKNAYTLITASEKNSINTALADLAPKSDMGRWVEKVATPKELVKVELDRVREQLENAGADLTGVPDELLMSFFKPSRQAPFGENIIKVNRGGQLEFYRLDKDLFETFHSLDMDSSSRLLKILSVPAQVLRAGVTLTPDFALMNAMRDTVSAAVISKYTSFPFQSTIRGMAALLNNPKLVAEWAASGGKQSVEANYFDRAKLQKFITEKITKDLTKAEQAMVRMKSPLTLARMFTGAFEEATRIGEYKAAFNKLTKEGMSPGDARRQAAFEARDLQDFAKGGAQTKIVRSLAAFWNAGLQGNVRLVQAFKERPFQTTLKGLAFITIPKLLEQALNWNDEDYWDRPQWERDLMFLIPRGKDENGRTKFLRIPTPFEVGLIFGTFPGRVLQAWRAKDPKEMASLPRLMLTQTVPNMIPQALMTIIEAGAGKQGYSFFRGRPIVPTSLATSPPELQFTEQNSLTAKKVGKLLGMSPEKIDYVISGLGGGVAKQLTHQVSDRAISVVTGEQRTAKGTMPGARFIATPAGIQSEAVDRFYKRLEAANADQERVKSGMPSKGEATLASDLNAAAKDIAELRKQARAEKDEVKRQAILLKIVGIAKNPISKMKTAAEVQQEIDALRRQRLAR